MPPDAEPPATALALADPPPGTGGGSALPGGQMAKDAVAQAAAMVVQDAGAHLRNVSAMSTAGIAVLLSKYVQSQDPKDMLAIQNIVAQLQSTGDTFEKLGEAAATVLSKFTSSG